MIVLHAIDIKDGHCVRLLKVFPRIINKIKCIL